MLHVRATAGRESVLAALTRARESARSRLLVVDEADRADDVLCDELGRLGDELRAIPALVIAAGEDPRALARLRPGDVLALAPLDEHAVRRIAVLYAPAGAEADVPVGVLVETSGGVPRRVHEVAGEWARRAAAQRVDAIAPRAAAGRRDARALEAALAGSLADLQAADERAALATDDIDGGFEAVACPYKGLAGFDVDDAEVFFGRERLVADLVARLVGAPLLGVVGPSGSGKSSVVRAGLMPALAAGMLPGSERWVRAVVRPGEHPLRELRRLAGPHVDGRRLVLVVDQFEELFTACRDAAERSAAVAELVGAAARGTLVVLALRADFYGRCADHPELSALLEANHVLVGPMGPDELRRAIELPARRAHLRLEPGLVDRLLADCEGEPGALPLLSTALLELWLAREGRELRTAAYERSGGMRGAVARLAEAAYGRLDAAQQVIAHRILLRLAGDDVHGVPVRRRVPLDELEGGVEVLAALADARLVTVDEATAEVAHEALLLEWPRLRGWLEEDADGRRLHRRLIQSAREWSAGGRDRGDLYRGARLAAALEWGAEHEPELTAVEREFLDAARAAAERSRRRLRLAFLGALALLAVATGAAALALEQRGRARENAKAAAARGLGAAALTEERLDRSLLLARQGVALDDAPASRGALLAALQRGPAAVAVIPGDGDALNAIALHPDGRTLAVGDDGGSVHLLDAVTRRRLGPPHQVTSAYLPRITALAFSPDGARLASAAANPGAFVDLFDVAARRHVARVAESFAANEASVGFSPNGRVLAVHMTAGARSAGPILLGDAALGRGARVPPDLTVPHASTLLGVLDTGGRAVTTSADAGTTLIRGAATPRPVRAFPVAGAVAAMSREAALVAFGRRDGSVRLLDLRSGELRRARGSHEGPVVALGFDPAGDRLVTAGGDQRLIVWNAARATALERLEARGIGSISDVAVGRDGGTAYTAGRDGAVVAWDLTGARRWERPFATDGGARAATSLATAAQGTHLAVADARGFVDVLEAGGLRLAARIRPRRGWVSGAQLSADGGTLALMAHDGAHTALELWDVRTRRRLGPPAAAHAGPATALSFSRDGRRLATGGNDAFVHVWDARTGARRAAPTSGSSATSP